MTRLGNGDGTFGSSMSTAYNMASTTSMKLGDLNGDGLIDIAMGGTYIETKLGNGDGTFGASVSYTGGLYGINLGDINGDGVYDVSSTGYGTTYTRLGNTNYGAAPLLPFDLTSAAESRNALTAFTNKLQQLSAQRGMIGAFQSRIQVGLNSLQSSTENYSIAASRIRDVDVADETSKMTRLSVLQQATSSVLTQANLQPQLAIKLLS